MSGLTPELEPLLSGRRALVGWLLAAFLLTFLTTRFVTQAIQRGRGPFRNASVGGVHLHHEVYGIFLMLGAGTLEFTYQPGPPWVEVLAVLFGVGAALTLDEFALWLRLSDVYWSSQGRSSVDAVLVASVVGFLLLLGFNPFDTDSAAGEGAVALTVAVNLVFALVAILKGRVVLGVVGVFVPVVAVLGALRLARPTSVWARRRYRPGSERLKRSRERYPPDRHTPLHALVDLFADAPTRTAAPDGLTRPAPAAPAPPTGRAQPSPPPSPRRGPG